MSMLKKHPKMIELPARPHFNVRIQGHFGCGIFIGSIDVILNKANKTRAVLSTRQL